MGDRLTARQRAAIRVLFMIVRILNPTGYEHQIRQLKDELLADFEPQQQGKG